MPKNLFTIQEDPRPSRCGMGCAARVCGAALLLLGAAGPAAAQPAAAAPAAPMQVQFNADFLSPEARKGIDVARFEQGNPVLPGEYSVDLYLNGQAMGRTNVTVKATDTPGHDPHHGQVCMTRALLDQAGLDWSRIAEPALEQLAPEDACAALENVVAGGHVTLDTGEMRLDLALPQSALRRTPRGYVNPELWDPGVTGGMLNYALNTYRNNTSRGSSTDSSYLNLNAGFNLGAWHLRHNGAGNRMSGAHGTHNKYQSINTYAERDIPPIAGRVTLGDGNTSGRVFDTQAFRGVQLASDDRMLPDSQRGYAPSIHGVAQTNARVTIRQNGTIIYDTPVPPGPFVIDDLYPTGYGGNLDVTVTEGDGRVSSFSVPYASVTQLLRPGASRYSLTGGVLRNASLSSTPKFLEATYQRGLSNRWTGYGGVRASDRYAAALGGVGLNTSMGALALDVTGARTQLPGGRGDSTGASLRAGYSKLFEQTGSNVAVAAYRYSTGGYYDLADAVRTIDAIRHGRLGDLARPRSRLSLTLNQSLGSSRGQFYLSGYAQNYWNDRRRDVQFQLGYSNRYRALSYSVSATRVHNWGGGTDHRVMLNLSIPLGSSRHAPYLSTNIASQSGGGAAVQTALTGTAGQDNQWSYGVTASHGTGSHGNTAGTVNGQYVGSRATVMAGLGAGPGYNNFSAGLSGSVVAHPEGVTLSPYPSDTVAVVSAPDAAGASVLGYPGIKLDGSGHAVLPYLTPYRVNEVAIDPQGISPGVELKTASQQVAPHAGSITMLRYATVAGRAVLIDATLPDGALLPFGADVTDGNGNVVGAVGQAGRIYARLPGEQAQLSVRWGQARNQQCTMHVALPQVPRSGAEDGIERLQLTCTPGPVILAHAPHSTRGESVK